jgi:hypothetical protein
MALDATLKTETAEKPEHREVLYADNENIENRIPPEAMKAVDRMIDQYLRKNIVSIKEHGSPDVVHRRVTKQFIAFGASIDLASEAAAAFVQQAIEHSERTRGKYGATYIGLKIETAKKKPDAQFETGAVDYQCFRKGVQTPTVAGSTNAGMEFGPGGTRSTMLQDSMSEILDQFEGEPVVYVVSEAPNKSELQGIAQQAAMDAVADIAGGGLAPEQVQEVLAELQDYINEGVLSPEMIEVLSNLDQVQMQAAEGNFEGITDLSQSISEGLETLIENGDISPEIADIVTDSLKEVVTQNLPLEQKIEILAQLGGAQEFVDLIQDLKTIDTLSPELSEMIQKIDALSVDELADALTGQGDPAIIEVVQATIVALNSPEVQASLPQATLNHANQFLTSQSGLVDSVTAQAIIAELNSAVADLNANSMEVEQIQQVIERLDAGDSISTVDPAIVDSIPENVSQSVSTDIAQAVTIIQNAQADAVVVSVETIQLDQGTILNLQAMAQSEVFSPAVKEQINTLLETPNNIDAMKAVQQSLGDNTPPAITDSIAKATMIQSGHMVVSTKPDFPAPAVVQSLGLMAEQAKGLGAPAQAELLKNSADIVEKFTGDRGTPPTVNETVTAIQKINDVMNRNDLSSDALSPEQKVELQKIKEKLVDALPVDVKDNIAVQLEKGFSQADHVNPTHQQPTNDNEQKFQDDCATCGGGKCPGCGTDFSDAIADASGDQMRDPISYNNDNDKIDIIPTNDNKDDSVKFQSPCDGCGGGKCPGCGTDFSDAIADATSNDTIEISYGNDNDSSVDSEGNVVSLDDARDAETSDKESPRTPPAEKVHARMAPR